MRPGLGLPRQHAFALGTVIALAGLEQTASSRKRAQTATNAQALHFGSVRENMTSAANARTVIQKIFGISKKSQRNRSVIVLG
jgi:hypothetical protein